MSAEIPLIHTERLPVSASVAGIVMVDSEKILLVKDREKRWDLPAGGVLAGEFLPDALRREFRQETGLKGELTIAPAQTRFTRSFVWFGESPKSRLGVVMSAHYMDPLPNDKGWEVSADDKIVFAKPCNTSEIIELLDHPDNLRKPEFNLHQLRRYLLVRYQSARNIPVYRRSYIYPSGYPENVIAWIKREQEKGTFGIITDFMRVDMLHYSVPGEIGGGEIIMDFPR